MKLNYFNAKDFSVKLKATIHKSGKLGFTRQTAEALGFEGKEESYIKFAYDEEDNKALYMVNGTANDGSSFRINKAGNYYYANTSVLFDKLGINYKGKTCIFDMIKIENEGLDLYKMTKRELNRKEA